MSWIKKRSPEQSLEILGKIARLCSERGPISKSLFQLFEKGLYREVLEYDFTVFYNDPCCNVSDLIAARQIHALLAKQEKLDLGFDRQAEAVKTFEAAEERCSATNRRFRNCEPGKPGVEAALFVATRKIAAILGDVPPLDAFDFSFGPGASTNVKGADANAKAKLSAPLECSTNLLPFVGDFLAEVPLWTQHHAVDEDADTYTVDVNVSQGKLMFVPKNYKTFRSIVVEPPLNGFFQKGVGAYIKDRLRRVGVDLRDQARNQMLARAGSVTGQLATVDLSSASDTVSRELVRALLPHQWFVLLDSLRTPAVRYRGKSIALQKFSSMGNAYTFELESLIFFSLACAVVECAGLPVCDVSVYGDDIIVPVDAYAGLVDVLEFCGFAVNLQKSYAQGYFRESCGHDYYRGIDIRPLYVKTARLADADLYHIHNWFLRRAEPEMAKCVKDYVDQTEILFGPDGYGDGHLIGSYTTRRTRRMTRSGWEGSLFESYSLKPRVEIHTRPGDWLFPSYSVYVRSGLEGPTESDVLRGSMGYKKVSIYTLTSTVFRR